ncbi:DUF3048 domain-containing protein [Candidatus Daviesbacteria bacterium]|nr:DUF3048 domain-containing protein [Candidatus Daviesbacteria bacterium]
MIDKFLDNLTNTQKWLVIAIMAVVIYVVSSAASYSIFLSLGGKGGLGGLTSSLPGPSSVVDEDPNEPRTEICPLDGDKHTKKAKDAWIQRRPLAVMIENHVEARPQSGLTSADVVYEAVAEGGITRFMAVYLCNLSEVQVGPVRSARTYFLDWVSEYDALYAHVGGANCSGGPFAPGCQNGAPADALGQIIRYQIKALNQFSIGFPTFWRDYQRLGRPVATEHTMYSTTQKLWEIGAKRGWTATDDKGVRWDEKFTPWKFADSAVTTGQSADKIAVNFWESQADYKVEWTYDSSCSCYKRKNSGSDHTDLNNKKQISPKNVIVQFMVESHANDGYENNVHLLYANKGQGKALIFQGGKVIVGKWVKKDRLSREKFVDEKGQEISLARGQIWIQTVPEGSKVTY